MKVTLGGDRLGSGKKISVNLHNFERSSHNLSRIWRSSMAPGVLVPVLVEPGLPGDTFNIDPTILIRTLPTNGPLYGSFKFQIDYFVCPIRLYNKQLHNNKLGIGRNMEKVLFPKITIQGPYTDSLAITGNDINRAQINQSSLLAYTGNRGIGIPPAPWTATSVKKDVNAMQIIAYWDIVKNYYANKQETKAWYIGMNTYQDNPGVIEQIEDELTGAPAIWSAGTGSAIDNPFWQRPTSAFTATSVGATIVINGINIKPEEIRYGYRASPTAPVTWQYILGDTAGWFTILTKNNSQIYLSLNKAVTSGQYITIGIAPATARPIKAEIALQTFDLSNIDDMRERILEQPNTTPLVIPQSTAEMWKPYSASNTPVTGTGAAAGLTTAWGPMAGLALKTYNSDRFNNWLSTEWIDGANGISQISAVSTAGGSFTMDTLNLAQKVYDMLNRIAVSGGSYYDWQEAVYGESARMQAETPMYVGGISDEIFFNEVVSTAETEASPLGSLGGRGNSSKRGNTIRVKIEEASYIIGIASITPRVDYSQGNKWFTKLNTMNDLHKPSLDGIGFQELITEEMAAWDSAVTPAGVTTTRSAGKQPAWIHYMTAVNETFGTFAEEDNTMFMTLNRRYTFDPTTRRIKDLTTYIDPTKYNYAFAQTDLNAQNFWVQIAMDITARRKISAKQIPNL